MSNYSITLTKRATALEVRTAEISSLQNHLRAVLAKQALENTALLAELSERLEQTSPSAREEYRLIVQAYARSAALSIMGGEVK